MKKRTVALCGAAAAVAGMLCALPSSAGASAAPQSAGLTWTKCPTKKYPRLECASLDVPLDHDRPSGRRITLALSRIAHTADKFQGPLLVNPGGPGGSGLALAGFVADSLPAKTAAQYDVIGFDPRGVGKSSPALNCSPGHFDPVRPPSIPDRRVVEHANLDRARGFAESCDRKYGDVLPFIDTVSAAHDVDAVRRALGAARINWFGYSYGTYLGAVYAKLHPERVRRMVLDSVVDPTGVWYRDNLDQDIAFNARHQAFLAWVARHDATYRLGTDPAEVGAKWSRMRQAVTENPAGGRVGGGELEDTFLPGGYFNGYWPDLARAFAAYVNEGRTQTLVDVYEELGAVDAAGENGYSVYAAVQCRDAHWPRDWNVWRADNRAVHAKAPFSTWNNAWFNAPCAFWPTESLTPQDVRNNKLPPVLLFQATEDAATPYEGGVTLHRALRGSSFVVERGGGNHGITLSGNACLDGHLSRYLDSGTVPRGRGEADAYCERQPDPAPNNLTKAATRGAALHALLGRH